MVTPSLGYEIGQGWSALDAQARRDKLDGFAVIDGLAVSHDSGLTLSVASGNSTVGRTGDSVDTVALATAGSVTLAAADSTNPRKDTIYIDTAGTLQVETGTARAANPEGNSRFDTFQPEPPLPSTAGTILAEVWVAAGATTLAAADIRDRREPADVVADELISRSHVTEQAGIASGYSMSVQPNILADWRADLMTELFYQHIPRTDRDRGIGYELFSGDDRTRLYINQGGIVKDMGTYTASDLKAAAISQESEGNRRMLIIDGAGDAKLYDSEGDFDADTFRSSEAGVLTPLDLNGIVGFENTTSGEDQFLWAEYGDSTDSNRVWNANAFNTDEIQTVLDISTSKIRHFHNLQRDPYNPSEFYLTSGDSDDEVFLWKSTDWGQTWTEEVNASVDTNDPQIFRITCFTFTPDHIYWVDDRASECKLARATRTQIVAGDYEVLHTFGTDATGRGVCRFFDHEGIIVNVNFGTDRTELWFYDITNDVGPFKLNQFDPVQGWAANTPYQNMRTGQMYMHQRRSDSIFRNTNRPTQVSGVSVDKFQIETA